MALLVMVTVVRPRVMPRVMVVVMTMMSARRRGARVDATREPDGCEGDRDRERERAQPPSCRPSSHGA
jgi:hypothetical protein